MNVEVIRIIRYIGSEEAVSKAIALSLPEGVRYCGDYEIQVATHSSTLPPVVKVSADEVFASLNQTERKTLGVTPCITDIRVEYKGPVVGGNDK